MGSVYLGIGFVIFFLTGLFLIVLKKKRINVFILILIYLGLVVFYLIRVEKNITEYCSYNDIRYSDVTNVIVNNKIIKGEKSKMIFEILKSDSFSWVNHPVIKKEYFVSIHTESRIYNFKILNTYNQGILVTRINEKGKEYVTNRNDNIIFFIK